MVVMKVILRAAVANDDPDAFGIIGEPVATTETVLVAPRVRLLSGTRRGQMADLPSAQEDKAPHHLRSRGRSYLQ